MRWNLSSSLRGVAVAFSLVAALFVGGCGGGGGDEAYLTVTFENSPASSQTFVQVVFDYFDLSGIPDRVETVSVGPNQSVSFEFDENQANELFDATLTWADMSTEVITLFPFVSSGGNLSYPVAK